DENRERVSFLECFGAKSLGVEIVLRMRDLDDRPVAWPRVDDPDAPVTTAILRLRRSSVAARFDREQDPIHVLVIALLKFVPDRPELGLDLIPAGADPTWMLQVVRIFRLRTRGRREGISHDDEPGDARDVARKLVLLPTRWGACISRYTERRCRCCLPS